MTYKSDEQNQEKTKDSKNFFVVGIGASAGGLRALEEFFENMPADSGAAFVVIQHLSPDFKSLMKELLERYTKMKVYRVEDGMDVEPNCVYLIPPGINLVIQERKLYFQQQDRNRPKPNFPIDVFLQSLAEDVSDRAVGIILSGSGSDGSEGLRLLNENGGIAMSQDPETAEFDGMPSSAISTRLVDKIGSPQELASVLYNYLKSPADIQKISGNITCFIDTSKLQQITTIINRHNNINFSHYKASTLSRRIHRRCLITECNSIDDYVLRLQEDAQELEILCNDLLIGVTKFFRDAKPWQFIENNIIPALVEQTQDGGEIRCWVSACATGEEAYSLAILIDEAISDLQKQIKVKIFATDIDKNALEKAAAGIYPENIAKDITQERLERYFIPGIQSYEVVRKLREMLIFAPQDLTKDAGFTRMHFISCRNVLIYMQPQLQKQVLRSLHFSLTTKGYLFLGESEIVGDFESEFLQVESKIKIFQKQRDILLPLSFQGFENYSKRSLQPLKSKHNSKTRDLPILEETLNSVLTDNNSTCLIVNKDNQVLHVFGNTADVLEIRYGRVTQDIVKLVVPALELPLNTALHRAKREKRSVIYTGINLDKEDKTILVSLKVSYHQSSKVLSGDFYRVEIKQEKNFVEEESNTHYFEADAEASRRIVELEYELQQTRENLQATIEELETTNEEQQATNEELIASNEELQSTNEELHSVNEELHTVNVQYQSKIHELTELNSDVENLLRTTDIGVVFLDRKLKIRKFTPAATAAINLVEADIDRPLQHLSHNMDCENFIALLEEVIENQKPLHQEVKLNKTDIKLLMRIFPYRQDDNSFDGLVITFVDISEIKKVQEQLHETYQALQQNEQQLQAILDNTASIIYVKDIQGRYVLINQQYLTLTNSLESEILGKTDYELFPLDIADALRKNDNQVIATGTPLEFEETVPFQKNLFTYLSIKAPLFDLDGVAYGICGISSDISNLLQANAKLEQQSQELIDAKQTAEAANHAKSEFLARMTHELRTPLNAILGFTQILHRQRNLQTQQKQYLDTILRSGHHLLALINDILDISKIEAGMAELHITSFDLYRLLDGIESMLYLKAKSKQLQLIFELAPEIPQYIQTDENKLRQVLINILGNAIKFTNSGKVELKSTVLARQEEKTIQQTNQTPAQEQNTENSLLCASTLSLHFQITDSGKGIATEELNYIFDAFVQSNPTYQAEDGTGLGLAICKRFVQLMGGDIQIHSTVGKGTTVEFDIIAAVADNWQVNQALPKGRVINLAPNQAEFTILVVEDNWDNRQLLIQILTPIGFKLLEANNGQEAIELWEEHHPNLILMDMRMPVMDGYQATKLIRDKETNTQHHIPIIALTATAFNENRELILMIGCDDFIPKPLQEEVLLERIARHTGAKYIYELDRDLCASAQHIDLNELTPQALQVMPEEWCREVNTAALNCNQNSVLQLIREIPPQYSSLQTQLNNLANNYQFDLISKLSEPF
ncbi:MAG: response regulator [Rivularia sp. (in: Bacteria)]|nr:response regulator [Rivularia sp. MS3]